jgi:hypothetical protein
MPSTLVEFIEKDEIVEEESDEFEGEFEMEEIVDMNSLYIYIIYFYFYFPSFIMIIRHETQNKPQKNKKP